MTAKKFPYHLPFLLPLAFLLGCPPTADDDDSGPADEVIWEEDDDGTNGFAGDAEPVDVAWTKTLLIQGRMEDCDYDQDEDWPWTGDEDNYRIEVPEAGYIDFTVSWDQDADLDVLLYHEPPTGNSVSPDEQFATSNDDGLIEFLYDDPHNRGDDFVIGVLCAQGAAGDYLVTVNWED